MSERLSKEHGKSHEHHHPEHEAHEAQRHRELEEASKKAEKEHGRGIEQIRHTAEKEALSAKELRLDNDEHRYKPTQAFVNRELKEMAYSRLLNRARKSLKPGEKLMSKFIHQPVVNAVSEATARTVGRPSGILGGGMLALAGTSIYYYITKHYGYDYNYFIFLLLLVAGFVTGWIVEMLIYILRISKR